MRVAVCQFATSLNVQENLASCVRIINEAATCKPDLIVLPEYCNTQFCSHQPSYVDHNQAWHQALSIEGDFLKHIAEQAKKYDCYIVINVTLRKDFSRACQDDSIKSNISVTTCLFSPLGKLIYQIDKQALTAAERNFFMGGSNLTQSTFDVAATSFGKLGLLAGNDDITFDLSREFSLGGAQLLCHSLSSFSLDQSSLYAPTRACENQVFLAQANKVGSLIPVAKSQEQGTKEQAAVYLTPGAIPQEALVGIGQSQILAPGGTVLAKLEYKEEGYVFADIDLAGLAACNVNNKRRPDGTDLIKQRRPELYQPLTKQLKKSSLSENICNKEGGRVPITANVAIFATYKSNEEAIEDVCHYIENNLSDIIQLPELFFVADKSVTNNTAQLAKISRLSELLISKVSAVLRPFQYLCTSLVLEGVHQAVLISEHGLLATQQQLHFCQRYRWTALGDELNIITLPLEQGDICLAMLTADDANIAEIVKVAALKVIHLLLVPFDIQAPCEVEYSLLSRATENRICIVAASREKSFSTNVASNSGDENKVNKNKTKQQKSTGLIINLTTNSDLLPQWKSRKFNGYINQPLIKHQHGKITKAVIHPIAACHKR